MSRNNKAVRPRRYQQIRHLHRVGVQIQIRNTNKIIRGRLFAQDLGIKGTVLFSESPFVVGQKIAILVDEPRQIYLKGEVKKSYLANQNSKIISANQFCFRVVIEFEFDTPQEQQSLYRYCVSFSSNHSEMKINTKPLNSAVSAPIKAQAAIDSVGGQARNVEASSLFDEVNEQNSAVSSPKDTPSSPIDFVAARIAAA